ETDGLAGFIAPIGPVRGDPNLNRADAVLGGQGEGKNGEEDESQHGLTYYDTASSSVRGRGNVFPDAIVGIYMALPTKVWSRRKIWFRGEFHGISANHRRRFTSCFLYAI